MNTLQEIRDEYGDNFSDPNRSFQDEMKGYVDWLEEQVLNLSAKIKSHNCDYTTCEECGSTNVLVEKVCNNCYAEVTISHIV